MHNRRYGRLFQVGMRIENLRFGLSVLSFLRISTTIIQIGFLQHSYNASVCIILKNLPYICPMVFLSYPLYAPYNTTVFSGYGGVHHSIMGALLSKWRMCP